MVNIENLILLCGLAVLFVGVFLFTRGGSAADDIESLTIEHFKKNLRVKMRKAFLEGNPELLTLAKVLSREEFRDVIKEGVGEGMAEELSKSVCDQAMHDAELQQLILNIADEIYEELSLR